MSMFIVFICLYILIFFKINFHLVANLGFYSDGFINICLFSYCQIASFWFLMLQLVHISYPQSSVLFQRNHWYLIILTLNGQPNEAFYQFFGRKCKGFNPFDFTSLGLPIQACVNVIGISIITIPISFI